jgi:hypothetical protein
VRAPDGVIDQRHEFQSQKDFFMENILSKEFELMIDDQDIPSKMIL